MSISRLQNVSTTAVEMRRLQRTRVEATGSANSLAIRELMPEVTRHHQLEKIARLVFDSRLAHQFLFLVRDRVQVVENRKGCTGSNKLLAVETNPVREKHLLQAL